MPCSGGIRFDRTRIDLNELEGGPLFPTKKSFLVIPVTGKKKTVIHSVRRDGE
jgi:hypothetical protein